MNLAIFLGIINLFKLWIIRYLPLLGDEAYYNLWSRYPAASYVDHPPMIAWIHGLVGQSEFGVRLMAILLLFISTILIYWIGKDAFGKKVGFSAAILFSLVPTYFAGGLFLTPEQPFILFWLLSLLFAIRLIRTQKHKYWYLLGISVGLGFLSKYPMLLFVLGFFVFLTFSKKNHHWLTKKEPYLALILALLFCSPVIIWNIQSGFPALMHHGARLGSTDYLGNIFYFLVLQFLMYSPPIFIFAVSTFFYGIWHKMKFDFMDDYTLLFASIFMTGFLVFMLVSPFTMIGGHWTSTTYLGIIVMMSHTLISRFKHPLRNWRVWASLIVIILLNALVISYYAFLYPIPEDLQGKAYKINHELDEYIREKDVDHVFSNQMGVGSLTAFYGKTKVYLPKGYWKQFDIWGQPELKPGDDILYFAFSDSKMKDKLKPLFREVKVDPQKRLFIKDSDIPIRTQVIHCIDYRRGQMP